jgi:gliding motility-associated-like protein
MKLPILKITAMFLLLTSIVYAQNNCNTALIRSTLQNAGNVELLGLDNSCSIYFYNPTQLSGSAAQTYAETFGANLVSVQTAAENTSISNALNTQGFVGTIWLGYSDEVLEGNFVWYDKSPAGYTNWSPTQPDNAGSNEDCTQIYANGLWNDLPCVGSNSKSIIEVSLCPQVVITSNKTMHCNGEYVTLYAKTILGSPNYQYTWTQTGNATIATSVDKTGNNDTVLVHSTANNTFTATSVDRYGCTGANTITLNPNPLPTIGLAPTQIKCFGDNNGAITSTITTSTAPYTYSWSNAATTANLSALTPGSYTLQVTDANGCIKSGATTTITQPAAALSISTNVATNVACNGGFNGTATIVATGGTAPYAYGWLTAPPQLSNAAVGLVAGTYNYGVKDANNCQVTGTATITEPTLVTVTITGNKENCENDAANQLTTLTATAAGGTGPTYTYKWTPSNATTATTVCNAVVGSTAYTVTAKDVNNCIATATVNHIVNPNPVATYTVDSVCVTNASSFKSVVTIVPVANITSYTWQFNGPSVPATATSSLINPTYTFPDCNKAYGAILIVTSNKNCIGVSSINPNAVVYCAPVPNFSFVNGCEKDATIAFTNASANGAGTTGGLLSAWALDATGAIVTTNNPTKVYNAPGNYTITLGLKDVNNCTASATKTLKIFPKPVANFTLTKGCLSTATLMSNSSTLAVPPGYTDVVNGYSWDNNFVNNIFTQDGTNSGNSFVYPLTATENMPNATLIVTTNNNCKDTVSKPVIVWPMPVVDYTLLAPCFPNATVFTNNTSIANGTDNSTITTMQLTWGDGQTELIPSATTVKNYNYAVSNAYTTELTATSNKGCETKLTVPVIIHPSPKASFDIDPALGCTPLCVNFTNTSTQNNLPVNELITNYYWNMGDYSVVKLSDNTASTKNAAHCYENLNDTTQHYTIKLIVATAFGCTDTLVKKDSIEVYPASTANFVIEPRKVDLFNPQMIVTDKSHLADEVTWVYQAGDSVKVANGAPLHSLFPFAYSYKDSGTYNVLQITKTINGCMDTATQVVVVKSVQTLYIPNTFTPNDDKHNDFFMVKGVGIKTLSLIIFDRWGEVVARIDDPKSKGWDGSDFRTGGICKTEVYSWKLSYTDDYNAEYPKLAGSVNLLR